MLPFEQIIQWLLVYRYVIIFPLIIFEGPLVSISAGFLSSINLLNIFIVYPLVVVADLIGDVLYYSIGKFGREKFLHKYGKYLRLKEERIIKIEAHFKRHTKKTIIIGKISHIFGAPILVAAGIAGVSVFEIFWANFIVTLPKYLVLLSLGYYFGQIYLASEKYLDYFSVGLLILGIILLILLFGYSKIKKRLDRLFNKLLGRV